MTAFNPTATLSSPANPVAKTCQDSMGGQCDPRIAEPLVRAFGSQSSSYFALQPACVHFQGQRQGLVPYVPVNVLGKRVNVVPTRPLAAEGDMVNLLQEFEQNLPGQPLYVGVDYDTVRALGPLGYDATMMGTEFSVDLATFSVRGKSMKQLRHARNLHRRCPVVVREVAGDKVDWCEVERISAAWRQNKAVKQRELGLLTRPPVFADEWGVRKFYAYIGDTLAGYVFFDPYFKDGQLVGYCANILRAAPEMNRLGLLDHIMLSAMATFRAEGVKEISLGIAPLHGVRRFDGDRSALRWIQRYLYRYGNSLYAFAPLAYHKSRYRGREAPWFVCSRGTGSLQVVATLLKGTGLLRMP